MRNAFVRTITSLAESNADLHVLSGDLGFSVFEAFEQRFPKQFLNVGIAEQLMVSMAAGLSQTGKQVIVYSIATFLTARAFEQIRVDLCYQNLPCTLVGAGAGFTYGSAGATHHATEDLSYLRALPNLRLYTPIDPQQVEFVLKKSIYNNELSYVRLHRNGESILIPESKTFQPITYFGRSSKVILVSCGVIANQVEQARISLLQLGVEAWHIALGQIKPFPTAWLEQLPAKARIFSIEENTTLGGLGGALAESLTENRLDAVLERIGVADRFYHLAYSTTDLQQLEGLDSQSITNRVVDSLKSKI